MAINNAQKTREYLLQHPKASGKEVASKCGVSINYVYVLRSQMKKSGGLPAGAHKKAKKWSTLAVVSSDTPIASITAPAPAPVPAADMVNHPPHYKTGGIETIDFIEAKKLNYHLGNVVKYVTRADHKGDRLENLQKAKWYLEREIEKSL